MPLLMSMTLSRASPCGVQLLSRRHQHPLLRPRGKRERDVISDVNPKVSGTSPYSVVAAVYGTCAQEELCELLPLSKKQDVVNFPPSPYSLSN